MVNGRGAKTEGFKTEMKEHEREKNTRYHRNEYKGHEIVVYEKTGCIAAYMQQVCKSSTECSMS